MPIRVSVTQENTHHPAPEATEHGHHADMESPSMPALSLLCLEVSSRTHPGHHHQHDDASPPPIIPVELTLQPSRSAVEASCSFSVQFSEALHCPSSATCGDGDNLLTKVLVTAAAPPAKASSPSRSAPRPPPAQPRPPAALRAPGRLVPGPAAAAAPSRSGSWSRTPGEAASTAAYGTRGSSSGPICLT